MATIKSKSKLDEIVEKAVAKELASFKKELGDELKEALSGVLASSGIAGPFAPVLGNVLDSVIAGRKIDVRSAANAGAEALTPQIGSFFNQSTAQLGEGLTGLFSAAQRNF